MHYIYTMYILYIAARRHELYKCCEKQHSASSRWTALEADQAHAEWTRGITRRNAHRFAGIVADRQRRRRSIWRLPSPRLYDLHSDTTHGHRYWWVVVSQPTYQRPFQRRRNNIVLNVTIFKWHVVSITTTLVSSSCWNFNMPGYKIPKLLIKDSKNCSLCEIHSCKYSNQMATTCSHVVTDSLSPSSSLMSSLSLLVTLNVCSRKQATVRMTTLGEVKLG